MLNLAVLLEDSARNVPDRVAVVCGPTRLTYAELDAKASQVAGALAARGIGPGDRVALSCPNLPWFPIIYYGILKVGATVVPLNILLTEREIAYHLADSAAKAYFCFKGTPELPIGRTGRAAFDRTGTCEHFVLLSADLEGADPDAIAPSPGTETLAEFTQRQPDRFASAATSETDTAVILYTSGTTGQPKGAELTHSGVVHNALLANRLFGLHPHDVHLLMLPLFHSFGQIVQMNAGFAASATIVLLPRFDAARALELMQAEQVTFFAGVPTMYHALLNCEDSGRFDLVDRKKDMIIRGGFNVYPRELEEVLLTHPEVSLAAVIGVPHPSHGEEVKALVIRAPGATITEADLASWCRQNMAAYKYPRIVEFRDSLPMTATGKILKRELAQEAPPALTQSRS